MSSLIKEKWTEFRNAHKDLKTLEILDKEEVTNALGWQAEQMPDHFNCIHFRMGEDLHLIQSVSRNKYMHIVEPADQVSIGLLKSIAQSFVRKLAHADSTALKAS